MASGSHAPSLGNYPIPHAQLKEQPYLEASLVLQIPRWLACEHLLVPANQRAQTFDDVLEALKVRLQEGVVLAQVFQSLRELILRFL